MQAYIIEEFFNIFELGRAVTNVVRTCCPNQLHIEVVIRYV